MQAQRQRQLAQLSPHSFYAQKSVDGDESMGDFSVPPPSQFPVYNNQPEDEVDEERVGAILVPPLGPGSVGTVPPRPFPASVSPTNMVTPAAMATLQQQQPKSLPRTLIQPLRQFKEEGEKELESPADSNYFASPATRALQLASIVKAMCFPRASFDRKAGSSQRAPLPAEVDQDRSTCEGVLQGLSLVRQHMDTLLARRLDVSWRVLDPGVAPFKKLLATLPSLASGLSTLLPLLGFTQRANVYVLTQSETFLTTGLTLLSDELSRVASILSGELVAPASPSPALSSLAQPHPSGSDSSDEEDNSFQLHEPRSGRGGAPTSQVETTWEEGEGENDGAVGAIDQNFTAASQFPPHQPHLLPAPQPKKGKTTSSSSSSKADAGSAAPMSPYVSAATPAPIRGGMATKGAAATGNATARTGRPLITVQNNVPANTAARPKVRTMSTMSAQLQHTVKSGETLPIGVTTGQFRVQPEVCEFGSLRVGCTYRLAVQLTNVGAEKARFTIDSVPPAAMNVRVLYRPGPVAAGMAVRLEIELYAGELGDWRQDLVIRTERDTFRLPMSASVVDALTSSVGSVKAVSASASRRTSNASATNASLALTQTMNAANNNKLGVARLISDKPSVFTQTVLNQLAGSRTTMRPAADSMDRSSEIGGGMGELEDEGDMDMNGVGSDEPRPPRIPNMDQKPFVDPSISVQELRRRVENRP
eukprot:TRINITY_DN8223_c0_g1_i3.p1 TRINITY_DN8223_c0_g1~~TRINITY_DN8223_c0_g1_i3.p1  ORF type:complete len:705 (-),score=191.71 TRINITY_DN8223_c0_g1_i3:105-2219(-)